MSLGIQTREIQYKGHHFGDFVEAYEKGRAEYSPVIYGVFNRYFTDPYSPVLDLGCGTGISTRPFAKISHQVTGCDVDSKMLQVAIKTENPNISFIQGSADSLPFQNRKFSAITMFCCYHWFCNEKATKEIYRVLDKEGIVFVEDEVRSPPIDSKTKERIKDLAILVEHAGKMLTAHPTDNKGYDPAEMLSKNGFQIVLNEKITLPEVYSIEKGIQKMQSMSSWHDVQRAGQENEAIQKLRDLYSSYADEEGIVHAEKNVLVILAKKINKLK